MTHADARFVHQHVVDAFVAQNAGEATKPIALGFALVGLYLHVERGFTGRAVQQLHQRLARHRRDWPRFALPAARGAIRPADVLAQPPGAARDAMIDRWCAEVWSAYADQRESVLALLDGVVPRA